MGQKTSPILLRLGLSQNWNSVWHKNWNYASLLYQDFETRNYLGSVDPKMPSSSSFVVYKGPLDLKLTFIYLRQVHETKKRLQWINQRIIHWIRFNEAKTLAVSSTVVPIIQSLGRTHWIKHKWHLNRILHKKNLVYVETKNNKHNQKTQSKGATPIFKIIKASQSLTIWTQPFQVFLLLKKIIKIHTFKWYITHTHFPVYGVYTLNVIIRPLFNGVYSKLDKFYITQIIQKTNLGLWMSGCPDAILSTIYIYNNKKVSLIGDSRNAYQQLYNSLQTKRVSLSEGQKPQITNSKLQPLLIEKSGIYENNILLEVRLGVNQRCQDQEWLNAAHAPVARRAPKTTKTNTIWHSIKTSSRKSDDTPWKQQNYWFQNTFMGSGLENSSKILSHIWKTKKNKTFKPTKIDVILKHHYEKAYNANLLVQNLSLFAIAFLKKNKGSKNKLQQLKNIAHKILLPLASSQNQSLAGVGFSFSGRVYGARKASSLKMLFGSVPFNTLEANIDYSHIMQKTRNGTWGFQTWLHFKKRKRKALVVGARPCFGRAQGHD